ncbi:MAG TPA: ATP-dependent DNA ligase [Steroidobacteraceae bacterium]|nr:ATP-dependent DNA ligase [Steroidobacteraceae bacterium]
MATKKRAQKKAVDSIPLTTAPMEAKLVEALPNDAGWQFEPKWDGFRCLAFRDGDKVELRAKSGKSLSRYFPEVLEALRTLPIERFVIDGELAIPIGNSLSFDALQMRLHPAASRVRKLSQQTPAILVLFDCLLDEHGRSMLDEPLTMRRAALEEFFNDLPDAGMLRLSPYTRSYRDAQKWLERTGGALDGVIAKRLDGAYLCGERAMLKVKRLRTADCVVGGFRYASGSREVGSLLLGLYNAEGKLDHVGFTSSLAREDRKELTRKLEKLIQAPGFTGNAPGAPSRWSTERSSEWEPLAPKLVVEVRYDHVSGDRFRHGTKLVRWRPDKAPRQCTFEQLQLPARPAQLVRRIVQSEHASHA